MEIIIGKSAGFCGGVNHSVTKTKQILEENGSTYCLGELVHNQEVINELENKGIKIVDSLDEVPTSSNVIIRAHGVPKETHELAKTKNINLIDLTCPKVLSVQSLADSIKESFVVVLGTYNHPEIIGVTSYLIKYYVIDNVDEVSNLLKYIKENNIDLNNVSLITQTTYSLPKFKSITNRLIKEIPNIKIYNTICNATEVRQKETNELSKKVDIMIIIGGKNSSNTKKLYEISSSNTKSYLIENYKELDNIDLTCNKIGIMAGASTPKESIDNLHNYLIKKYN